MTSTRFLLISAFGVAGVFARYYLGIFISKIFINPFPLGTLLINVSGSFMIGLIYVMGVERGYIQDDLRIAIIVGFLGSFTTFSSFCLEINLLLESAKPWYAVTYFSISSTLGIFASIAGMLLARKIGT